MTQENLDIFDSMVNGSINPAQDSSDVFGSLGAPQKWPRNERNLVLIKYCFRSPFERQELEPALREVGIGYWMNALGGEASRQTGHDLAFEEALDRNGQLLFCNNPDGFCKFSHAIVIICAPLPIHWDLFSRLAIQLVLKASSEPLLTCAKGTLNSKRIPSW